jgi:cupin fold WbuC family metalloprotein
MKIFDSQYLVELTSLAVVNQRQRQHRNIHKSYQDACQRLFNAMEPGTYIRPHRHASYPREELLIAVRGLMTLVSFDERGNVTGALRFGSDKHGDGLAAGAELPPGTWHTVIALVPGCVLLEVKAGPFDPDQPKDLAPWAPQEGSSTAADYLKQLVDRLDSFDHLDQ